MMENYEEDSSSLSSDRAEEKTRFWKKERGRGGGRERPGGDEQPEEEVYEVAPTAKEYGSMLHILSKSKDVQRGANWERSMQLLREAQENEFPIDEGSFQTGIVCARDATLAARCTCLRHKSYVHAKGFDPSIPTVTVSSTCTVFVFCLCYCFRRSLLSSSFSVLTDLGYAGKVELAFSVFDDMRMAGIPLTVNTYNRLLGVCEKVWSSKLLMVLMVLMHVEETK